MNNFKSLIQSATKATANLISQQYEKNKQEQLEMQKLNRLRICEQATQDYINQIHPELAYIFRQTSISRLQPIQHPGDLLNCGYIIRPDYSPRLYFLIAKTNPQVILAQTTLDVITEKMNLAILFTINRYKLLYQKMDAYKQSEFMWNHPSCNYGFHITNCRDIGDDIRIEVALGFPT